VFAHAFENEIEAASGVFLNASRDADPARLGQRFEAGRDIDAIACITDPWSMIFIFAIVMSRLKAGPVRCFSAVYSEILLLLLAVSRFYLARSLSQN
jgi:hypothetical protein